MSPRRAVQVEPLCTASVSEAPVAHFFGLGAATGAEEAVAAGVLAEAKGAGVLAEAEGATLDPADAEGLTESEAEERAASAPWPCRESPLSRSASSRCAGCREEPDAAAEELPRRQEQAVS
ncbi:hypothetical protein ACIGKG_32650 [Streptomyces rochei]|uniref:hypothetical protein n=1 Tax=Streptomyces rochei TaxID=1928 RepID=UPI0037D7F8BB